MARMASSLSLVMWSRWLGIANESAIVSVSSYAICDERDPMQDAETGKAASGECEGKRHSLRGGQRGSMARIYSATDASAVDCRDHR